MVRIAAPVGGRRLGWVTLGFVAGTLSATIMYAQQQPPPAQQPPAPSQQAQATPTTRTFPSDAAMVLNFIKPDKTADFESVIIKLKEALAKSEKPERKDQARGWKIFKATDPAQGGNALYVFIVDPPVKGADYTISNILNEAFPNEVQDLYKKYGESYATGMNFVNLSLVADLGK
jgi:hypothetical protein